MDIIKTVIIAGIIIATISIGGSIIMNKFFGNNGVTEEQLDESQQIQNIKLDSIKTIVIILDKKSDKMVKNQNVLIDNQVILTNNQDSLKKGQALLFRVLKKSKKSFVQTLIEQW